MIVPTSTVVALHCPACGKMELNSLSLFEFSGSSSAVKKCSCGEDLINIYSKDRKVFWLQFYCVMCDSHHVSRLKRQELWSPCTGKGFEIYCDETTLEVGYIGTKGWVQEKIMHQPQSISDVAKEMGFTEYFTNPEVMYEILEQLYHMAENGNLFCSCGNHNLEIEIFPENLEIMCEDCGSRGKIMAETEDDLKEMLSFSRIKLTNKKIFCPNDTNLKKGSFKKK
ncbi:MAG: hypothetical protein PWQ96_1186 [Clostridia bacterium]|jgi:hypothetical protein|nr:hypothetical protein [Clostridiales bacterium]MDK2985544.1 hypothetical protein [Clostridia bacterium]